MKRAGLHGVWIGVLVLVSVAHAGPEIAFNSSPLVFNPVVVGEDRDTTLVVKKIGLFDGFTRGCAWTHRFSGGKWAGCDPGGRFRW